MKRITFISLLIIAATFPTWAQTPGTLTVSVATSAAGGNYAPKNIVAIWIEDNQGNFVKTLLAYAQTRKTHLNTWEASTTAAGSPYNTVDAITGATKTSHATRTCSWDGTDINGNIVSDGTYKLRMELTDKNGTGNFSTFTFEKDTLQVNLTPANVPSFSSIVINWEPVITAIGEPETAGGITIYPNPSSGVINLTGKYDEVIVFGTSGRQIVKSAGNKIDLTASPDGLYFVHVRTGVETEIFKVVKTNDVEK